MALILSIFVALFASTTYAASDGYQVLDQIQATYQPLQLKWQSLILPFAYGLFWKLVLVDVAWSTIKMTMERKDIGEIMTWFMQKAITVGFFFTLLKMSSKWIPDIIGSFELIGKKAGGTGDITPDGILNVGIDLATNLIISVGKLGILDQIGIGLFVVFVALFVIVCFIVIAGQLLVALIESYIVIGGGIIMLGFTGSNWTKEMGTSYLKYAVGAGAKIMVSYLIVGAGIAIFNKLAIDTDHLIKSLIVLFANAGFFAFLALQIPNITSAMVAGSPSSTLGGVMAAAAGVAGAMVGAGAATRDVGIATAGGAYNVGSRAMGLSNSLIYGRGNTLENTSMGSSFVPNIDGSDSRSTPAFPNGTGMDKIMDKIEGNASSGDASKASISGSTSDSKFKQYFDNQAEKRGNSNRPLHEKIKNAGNVLPNDQANIQVSGINMSHGKE